MIRRRRRRHDSNESSSYKNVVLAVLAIYTIYIIFLSSSFSLAPSHHHQQQQHDTNKQSSPVPLSRTKNVASVRTCVSSPFFDPVFHAYVVSSKGDIISPLEIRRSLNTSPKKWVLASSSSSRTIPPPILPDSTNSTYEIFIDIHFEPVSMSEKHTVKLFVSYVFVQVLRTESTHSNTQIRYSSMAESLRDYPFANAMTYVVLRVGLVS